MALSAVCAGIRRDGGRCTASATPGREWCFNHDPAHAGERKRNASRAGRSRGSSEITELKKQLSDLAEDVLEGRTDRGDAAVVSQILNTYIRAVSVELKVKETQQLAAKLDELEARLEEQR